MTTRDDMQAMMVRGIFCVGMTHTQFDPFESGWDELPAEAQNEWRTIARNLFNMISGKDSDATLQRYIERNIEGPMKITPANILVFLRRVFIIANNAK